MLYHLRVLKLIILPQVLQLLQRGFRVFLQEALLREGRER